MDGRCLAGGALWARGALHARRSVPGWFCGRRALGWVRLERVLRLSGGLHGEGVPGPIALTRTGFFEGGLRGEGTSGGRGFVQEDCSRGKGLTEVGAAFG